ncbi:ATP-binding protein [Psychrobacillus sp. NPDC096389]|uniref:ATP-binding protein n=1 Tax=Psychrobacillus sp. NPDC096389 TaxID=3364490 RepID=UPI00381E62BE
MEIITFALKPIIGKIAEMVTEPFIKRIFLKSKLKKISDFQIKYEGSSVDTNTFQKFLNERENAYLIFEYVFGAKHKSQSKSDFIEYLSSLAIQSINDFRRNAKLNELSNDSAVNAYFADLLKYLEIIRDSKFKTNEMQIIANIQSSIVEGNEDLKRYLEKNFYELEQISLIKKYDDEYLNKLLNRNISDLGKRYNAEANVTTKYNKIFNSLIANDLVSKEFGNSFENLKTNVRELEIKFTLHLSDSQIKKNFITDFLSNLNAWNYHSIEFYSKENKDRFLSEIDKFSTGLDKLRYKMYEEEFDEIESIILREINRIHTVIRDIHEKVTLFNLDLIEEPYLLFYGDGGIGKSHLLADNSKELMANGHSVLLYLGQHFNTREHPINQMLDLIDYKGSKDYFFREMNNRAKHKNKKMLIVIDAMNEGEGKFFWRNYLLDFLNYLKEFEWISVALSVRSNFLRSVLPENIDLDFPLHKLELKGFEDLTLEQLEPFFNFYKINPLVFPSMESECYNPLFLQIYCETFEEKYEGYKSWSIVDVLEKYVSKVNERLSIDPRFPFPSSINLVDKILRALSKKFLENKTQYIADEEFYQILNEISSRYTSGYREILMGLEEESLLTVNKGYQGKGLIYFTYERFSDIYISLNIVELYKESPEVVKDLVISDDYFYTGINESLTILFAEKLRLELLDVLEDSKISIGLAESFIRGISWRNVQFIEDNTIRWIKVCLSQDDIGLRSLTYERLIKQSIVKDSPINILFLNELLFDMSMSSREYSWTIVINNNLEVPKKLIEHVLKESISYQHFKYENFLLLSYTLIWLFTTTNKSLRDISTNALTRIYLKSPKIIVENLTKFININDSYILERLLASIYGAVVRLETVSEVKEIVDIIYNNIFTKDEVYPNILVRDYARGIILFFIDKGIVNSEDYFRVNPPYTSKWFINSYTIQDIDQKSNEIKQEMNLQYTGFDYIVNSMTTEYGRGIGGYGDFGRYTFGSALRDWRNQFNDQDLSNIAIMRILEYGYDEKKHGYYDRNLRNYDRHENKVERIGKKYQWLALYEMLARLSDNHPIYEEKRLYTTEYIQYRENESQRRLAASRPRISPQENDDIYFPEETEIKVLKEEEHYLGTRKIYKDYTGIWDSFIRKYDPTLIMPPPKEKNTNLIPNLLPYKPSKEWAQSKEEFNKLKSFIFVDFDGIKYISLSQLLIQQNRGEKFEDKDEFCIKTKAILLSKNDKDEYIASRMEDKGNLGVSWPHSSGIYALEHFWHPAFNNNFYNESTYKVECEDAIWEYFWESNTDIYSLERATYTYLLPNQKIVNYFELIQSSEGVWKDREGNIIAFDSKYYGFESNLLFKKDAIEEYLAVFNLDIIWECYMEKWSDRSRKEEWFICWLEDEKVQFKILEDYKDDNVKDFT